MTPYEHYMKWCGELGITPASEEKYEQVAGDISQFGELDELRRPKGRDVKTS
jgi:hypothetical protein